jgi:transcriptional regulator with XRE-family HTH domain
MYGGGGMKNATPLAFDNSERITEIGYAIAYYRKKCKLSQEQVAEMVGISRQHMGAIEAPNMSRGLSLDLLLNISAVLKVEPYLLFKFPPE